MSVSKSTLPVFKQPASAMPAFKVSTAFGCFSRNRLEQMPTDLLVLTAMHGVNLPAGLTSVDKVSGGSIVKALKNSAFNAHQGEHQVIDLSQKQLPQKYVLVVGLGDFRRFNRRGACGLFSLAIDEAVRLGVKNMLIPIAPSRLSASSLSLTTTAATLRCCVEQKAKQGALGKLEEIQLVCAPQAKRYVETGLAVDHQICPTCTHPTLGQCQGCPAQGTCSAR